MCKSVYRLVSVSPVRYVWNPSASDMRGIRRWFLFSSSITTKEGRHGNLNRENISFLFLLKGIIQKRNESPLYRWLAIWHLPGECFCNNFHSACVFHVCVCVRVVDITRLLLRSLYFFLLLYNPLTGERIRMMELAGSHPLNAKTLKPINRKFRWTLAIHVLYLRLLGAGQTALAAHTSLG